MRPLILLHMPGLAVNFRHEMTSFAVRCFAPSGFLDTCLSSMQCSAWHGGLFASALPMLQALDAKNTAANRRLHYHDRLQLFNKCAVLHMEGPLEVLLMPGLAFDVVGRRCGRAGGYYDKLLARVLARAASHGWPPPLLGASVCATWSPCWLLPHETYIVGNCSATWTLDWRQDGIQVRLVILCRVSIWCACACV